MVASTAIGVAGAVLRGVEFAMLPFRWDAGAYASCAWGLLVIQSTHQLTALFENGFFTALVFRGPIEEKHRSDIEVASPLWYFVAAGSVLVWAVLFVQILVTRRP
jgi:heme/copper-type cytochrome/quinol oxidase subunit 3